tara:strand:- start:2236 stop:4962 length:2727 start_codon:yes stop_codon:yes gene_type:complete
MGWFKKIFRKIKRGIDKVVDTVTNVGKKIGSFVGDAFGFVIDPMSSPEIGDPSAFAEGIKATKSGTNVSIPVVYGQRRVGGTVIYAETGGDNNKYLYVCYAICEGPIHEIQNVYIDDRAVEGHDPRLIRTTKGGHPFNVNNLVNATQGRNITGLFKDVLQYELHRGDGTGTRSILAGTPNPTSDANNSYNAPSWNIKNRRGNFLSYGFFKFTYKGGNDSPWKGGIPAVSFDVLGREIADIRNTAIYTPGASDLTSDYTEIDTPDATADSAGVASNFALEQEAGDLAAGLNPANALLDYLLNPRYGCGLPKESIDPESFRIAAEKFNQNVAYSSTQTGKAMTCNAVIQTDRPLIENVKILLNGCRGILPYVNGRYKLVVDDGGNATDITSSTVTVAFDVDANEFVGPVSLTGETKSTKYNKVLLNYVEPAQNFTNQQVVHTVDADRTADGVDMVGEFSFPTLTNVGIARELARTIYDKSRTQRTISFETTQELMDTSPGDIIRVTDEVIGLTNQTFRIVSMSITTEMRVKIEAVEHDASLYPFVAGPQIENPPRVFLPSDPAPKPRQTPVGPVEETRFFPGGGGGNPPPGGTPPPPQKPPPAPRLQVSEFATPNNAFPPLSWMRPVSLSEADWNARKTANSFNLRFSLPLYIDNYFSNTRFAAHDGRINKHLFDKFCPLIHKRYDTDGVGGHPYNFEVDTASGVSSLFDISGGTVYDFQPGSAASFLKNGTVRSQKLFMRMALPKMAFDFVRVRYIDANGANIGEQKIDLVGVDDVGNFTPRLPLSYGLLNYLMDSNQQPNSSLPGDWNVGGIPLEIHAAPNVFVQVRVIKGNKEYEVVGDFTSVTETNYTDNPGNRTYVINGVSTVLPNGLDTFINFIIREWIINANNPARGTFSIGGSSKPSVNLGG